ncbi:MULTISPECIES: chemotaxis response regulator protein-glutamate methylesterase [unclassified Salinivibrio]|uniref:protein-glutamate methylesterase/protein-glutamine glutaminase n=1 Tax=unclassified Salinivibrio TaxID=2636825 RepID=UPI000614893E|nr:MULTISPECIES: chemotaxis response regulator protein-glutamate methylesterase [unclassified Salinivibrio]KKA45369.1 chemotaxis protein [Salinivibrio sp. KP-1]MPS32296.1 chemotaxis response regulator protein-glutamate methylesterase [Salinivibrio sp. VYel7]MPX93689.1 chemotaxis response regulator protein-glutamate methylesterase [Salinivibrio sp. VYel9]MPX96520.1 chemotaxis response regulator protein-glutamate methylesterase [Salinivibrio sp. VYel6]MPX99828.1 chemotaxis response regulator pro
MSQYRYKVLVVDDSPLYRTLIRECLESDAELEVVGAAADPYEAREKIKKLNPDVITLDVEMPKMDGIQFLKNLMRLRPMPVIMVSTLTQHGADVTLAALEIGAVDYVPKPSANSATAITRERDELVSKVKMAAQANVGQTKSWHKQPNVTIDRQHYNRRGYQVIGLGASTGGTEALRGVLERLPAHMPPIVVTQHIKAAFCGPFAKRLDRACRLQVEEVTSERVPLVQGHVYVAPGNQHLTVVNRQGHLYCQLSNSDPVERHRPSVDVMFSSIAESVGGKSIGVILTGMGRDGANGLLQMYQTGALTAAQDQASSVVWGMPRVAIELGGVAKTLCLTEVANFLVEAVYGR